VENKKKEKGGIIIVTFGAGDPEKYVVTNLFLLIFTGS